MIVPEVFISNIKAIDKRLIECVEPGLPESMRDPILYFLKTPSKKIRPLLTLYSSAAVGGTMEDALHAAVALELFHDFTLVHDDIMDRDELRRGMAAMHVKYGDDTAILVGDAMIGLAMQELTKIPNPKQEKVLKIFSEALVRVCEGQVLDKEFENREEVSLNDYLEMIGKKTAWLIKVSCALGAICGGGNEQQVESLSRFGYLLGLSFQIQDDLLDFIADQQKLGKKVGSDFEMDKKTYVTLKYRETLKENPDLAERYPMNLDAYESFAKFQEALHELGIVAAIEADVKRYMAETLEALAAVQPLDDNNMMYQMTRFLQNRQY